MSAGCRTSAFTVLAVCAALVGAPAAGAQDKAAAPPDRAGLAHTTFAAATVKPAVPVRAFPFDLKKVRLLDGPFKHAQEVDAAYLLRLEPDRLLTRYGNGDMFVNSVDWSAEQEDLASITPRETTERTFTPPSQLYWIFILLSSIFLIPGLILLGGVSTWLARRRQG